MQIHAPLWGRWPAHGAARGSRSRAGREPGARHSPRISCELPPARRGRPRNFPRCSLVRSSRYLFVQCRSQAMQSPRSKSRKLTDFALGSHACWTSKCLTPLYRPIAVPPPDQRPPEGRRESPLWLAQASKLAPAHALCGTILATILHLRSHRRAKMSTGVSPR